MNYERLKLMRVAARVERLHTLPTIYRQSVGEHTFGVMAILLEIVDASSLALYSLLRAALYHDVPEAITGDVPSPAKWSHPILEEALKECERSIASEFGLDYDVSNVLSSLEHRQLKFADLMEGVMFAIEEADTGNKRMVPVAWNGLAAIKHKNYHNVSAKASQFYEAICAELEMKYPRDTGEDVTHGWPRRV